MLLHRYFGSHAFETLKEAKLKTSRISSFNDPFEFLYISSGKTTAKKARKYILSQFDSPAFLLEVQQQIPGFNKKTAMQHLPAMVAAMVSRSQEFDDARLEEREELTDKCMRVVCLSAANVKPLDEILMWSHYATKHSGVRIGFEFPDGITFPFMVEKINYGEKRVAVDFSLGSELDLLTRALRESVLTKSLAWSYENEYRLITLPEHCEKRTINSAAEHFLDFKPEWVKSIDFGVRCPKEEIQRIVNLIKSSYPNKAICKKAVFHKSEYALDYVEI